MNPILFASIQVLSHHLSLAILMRDACEQVGYVDISDRYLEQLMLAIGACGWLTL